MSYSPYPSYADVTSDIGDNPHVRQVWRDDRGLVHATVELGGTDLGFRHPAHARAVAAACIEAAEAMEKMEAEGEADGRA